MLQGSVKVLSYSGFCVSDASGDFLGEAEQGLFYRDMRHLSRYSLTINGEPPERISARASGDRASFFLAASANGEPNGLGIIRNRTLTNGLREEIHITNYTLEPARLHLHLATNTDFADLFEACDYSRGVTSDVTRNISGDSLHFEFRREDFQRGTLVRAESPDGEVSVSEDGILIEIELQPKAESVVRVAVELEADGEPIPAVADFTPLPIKPPSFRTDWKDLQLGWEQSVADLRTLGFRLNTAESETLVAAGLPWFLTLFGRDTLITAYQTLHLGPDLAKNVLRALARLQATKDDPFRDAKPGKILHELRLGKLAHFGDVPHSPYYGTVDATPLFLVLLHETWRWTADEDFIREMEPAARRALDWIQTHSDSDGDGFADYKMRSQKGGLENQGWKDSRNSLRFSDGSYAAPPIALCEVQGYNYDAYTRSAELAEKVWSDPGLAEKLRSRAVDLKARFDWEYWIEDRGGYYALALDGEGRKVDSITSNIGHLLWSGIVPEKRAETLVRQLLNDALYSGWGVRTMAEGEGAYNPLSYHNGSVWPHDTSLTAFGLYRYGYGKEAARIARDMTEAARWFDYRLPEVFTGYGRKETGFPAEYPETNSPQAWAASTIPLLIRIMLGLEPDPDHRTLTTDASLPENVTDLHLEDVPAFGELHSTPQTDP